MAVKAWNYKIIDVNDGSTTVSSIGVIVQGVYVNTATTNTLALNNGDDEVVVIPTSTAAGTVIQLAGEEGILFDENLVAIAGGGGAGLISVFYKDQL